MPEAGHDHGRGTGAGGRVVKRRTFAGRLSAPLPRVRDVVRFMWADGRRPSGDDPDRVPISRRGPQPVGIADTALTWVGHATYLMRTSGRCVLADPVWSHRIPGVPRRLTPPGVAFSELPAVDAVVISHNHYDHLDAPTVRRLPRNTPFLVPLGLRSWFTRRGFTDVTELDWWSATEVAGLRFDFVPAHHWSRRSPWDGCRSLWGGWVITGPDGTRLYHAGDSAYGPNFAEIGRACPGIDVAMLPIGAYEPRWFMKGVHMNPEEAVGAVADLGAARLASMHWGTFALTPEPPAEPLTQLRKAWLDAGYAPEALWDLAVGETRGLEGNGDRRASRS